MREDMVCQRSYSDGDSTISFSIGILSQNDKHAMSYVGIYKDGVKTKFFKIVGIDPMHSLMLAVIECAKHIHHANQESIEGLKFLGDKDLGLPDKILESIAE